MDPNANLARQRTIVSDIAELVDQFDPSAPHEHDEKLAELASELADLVGALDEWIVKGGFLPDRWRP